MNFDSSRPGGEIPAPAINNFLNNSQQAEISISPTIIVPLNGNGNGPFKVRTLLDPGSGTNWIVKDLLHNVQYTKMGQEHLEVVTFSGNVKKKFPLVEVYYQDRKIHYTIFQTFKGECYSTFHL